MGAFAGRAKRSVPRDRQESPSVGSEPEPRELPSFRATSHHRRPRPREGSDFPEEAPIERVLSLRSLEEGEPIRAIRQGSFKMLRLFMRFLGRVLFAFLFISSGLSKMQGFYDNSSKFVSMLQPRISQAVDNVWTVLHLDVAMRPEINSAHAVYALYVTIFLELVGGVCFVIFPTFGSALIALYLMYITPIMHDFYNHPPGSQQYVAEMIHFLKNVALLGAAFFVMGGRQNSSGKIESAVIDLSYNVIQ